MAKIEGFRVENFGALKDVGIGSWWKHPDGAAHYPLTPLTAVIGKNGTGKTTLFDAFGFLADCLRDGVEEACDARGRGGFNRIRSAGPADAIQFSVRYREEGGGPPIDYTLVVDVDDRNRPFVEFESLSQPSTPEAAQSYFLVQGKGEGLAWKGLSGGQIDQAGAGIDADALERFFECEGDPDNVGGEAVELADSRKLGIATLGSLRDHPRISAFRRFLEGWHLSYFTPDAVRGLPLAGPQRHLNVHGDNLANVVQHMERENPSLFRKVLKEMAEKIPGIGKIEAKKSEDDRLLLCFNDKGFKDPFYAQQMSDGTLKMFAYLLLLEDQEPPSFLCIEEPENGLHHKLLEDLAHEFRGHAEKKGGSQIFVTTHQPHLLDALELNEVWALEKGSDGFATITPASEIPYLQEMVQQGRPLGSLWYGDYFDKR